MESCGCALKQIICRLEASAAFQRRWRRGVNSVTINTEGETLGQLTATEVFSGGILIILRSDTEWYYQLVWRRVSLCQGPFASRCILSQNAPEGHGSFFFVASFPIYSLIHSTNFTEVPGSRQGSKDWGNSGIQDKVHAFKELLFWCK